VDKNIALVRKALTLGVECYKRSEFDKAELLFKKALQIDPNCFDACHFLGVLELLRERFSKALPYLNHAHRLRPEDCDANHHLGLAFKGQKDLDKAFHHFSLALKVKPDLAPAHLGIADVLSDAGRFEDAIRSYNHAIKCAPKLIKAYNNLGTVYRRKGLLNEAIDAYRKAISISPDRLDIHSNMLMCMATAEHVSPAEYLKEARVYAERARNQATPYRNWPNLKKNVDKSLRVGFVSGDLKRHPAAEFIKSFIPYLDRSQISLIAFSTSAQEDNTSEGLRHSFQEWYVIEKLSDRSAAALIYEKEIDILIDMSGHTSGNRLPIFAWKAAPVQISWVGYFASTGMSEIDYLLPNAALSPPEFECHYAETPWLLNPSACLALPDELPDVGSLPAATQGQITFGSFHSLAKISEGVLALWCSILQEVPHSKMFFKCRELVDARFRKKIGKRDIQ
jgi:predicted O-linked N-acetylglucosamine transferase (SPINDLY family)